MASFLATVRAWIEHQRARALAGPAVESPSVAHAAVLRRLQALAARTGRAERAVIIERIERCRRLVLAARGIGAENAMAGFITRSATAGSLDLAALEFLLASRDQVNPPTGAPRLLALLVGEGEARSALVAADLASVLGRDRAEGAESGHRVPLGPDPDPSRRGGVQRMADRDGGVPGEEAAHLASAHGSAARALCSKYVDGAIGSWAQIGSTPYAPRCASMNATIRSRGGRAPPGRNTPMPSGGSHSPGATPDSRARAP